MTEPTTAPAGLRGMGGGMIPSHVSAELVRDIADLDQPNDRIDPFALGQSILDEYPPLFYWPKARPGMHDGVWVVTRYEDIAGVYENDDLYSTRDAANFQRLVGEDFPMIPLGVDPPDHPKYRAFLNPVFSPKALKALDPGVRTIINELIDGFVGRRECDVAYEFGRVYPVRVFLRLMGLPEEDLDQFLQWEYALLHSRGNVEKMQWGARSALDYLRAFIEKVRNEQDDSLVSKILRAQIDGRDLTEDEIIGTVFFLWVGGLDTVAATTALMFRRLALQLELQEQLRADPELVQNAVEEFLRTQPLVNSTRLVKKDHEIHGVQIRAGEHIMALNLTGNFDPAKFPTPRDVRFDRAVNRHYTFAGGRHLCLGMHLARRELRIALSEFLRRVPPFRMAPDADIGAVPGLIATGSVKLVWEGSVLPE